MSSKYGFFSVITILLFLFIMITLGTRSKEPITKTDLILNTVVTITLYDSDDIELLEECFALCRSYETVFSRTNSESELYQLNETFDLQSDEAIPLSNELYEGILAAFSFAKISNNAFTPAIEPVSSLWDFTNPNSVPPTEDLISSQLSFVDSHLFTLDNQSILATQQGVGIDLGGIAKGYIADQLKTFLIEKGVTSAMIDLGGNLVCIGSKPDGDPFQVGIQDPSGLKNEAILTVSLTDTSVATCGIYERNFTYEGVTYHHILNPNTGYPYENNLASVTIITPYATNADGLSTTCYALGLDAGLKLITSYPNTYGIFIDKDGSITYSEGFDTSTLMAE